MAPQYGSNACCSHPYPNEHGEKRPIQTMERKKGFLQLRYLKIFEIYVPGLKGEKIPGWEHEK